MAIGFREIPQNLRVPLFFAELDNSRANSGSRTSRTLIIGQKLAAGTAAADVPVMFEGIGASKTAFGQGSMLALMAEQYRARDTFGEVWLLPVADNGAGVAATGTIVVTAPATASGTYNAYIAGVLVSIPVNSTLTTANIATALAAAINGNTDLPVTAAVSTNTVTITARHKGLTGNDIDLRSNYRGPAGGEAMPVGMAVTITAMSGGTTTPSLTAALAALGSGEYDLIAFPYTDSAALDALKTFLADRWAWNRMLYGHAFAAFRGTVAARTTFGNARNDPHVTVLGFRDSPTPSWLWAASLTAATAVSVRADPGLPLQSLALNVLAPPVPLRDSIDERNVLLFDGVSTHTVDDDGTVRLETIITTYQVNPFGQPDDSYLYVERLFVLMAIIRDLKAFVTSTFGRFKLADDAAIFAPGANIVTAPVIRSAIVMRYRFLCRLGLAQEPDAFEANLVVERNAVNRCRVDGLLPVVPIDQLRQVAALIQFRNSGEGGA